MGLALDGPKEADIIFNQNDIIVLGDDQMQMQLHQYGGLIIDHLNNHHGAGFSITFGEQPQSSCC